jgi:dihydrofolate reductase
VTDPQNRGAPALNTLPTYMVTASLAGAAAGWHNTTVVDGDVIAAVRHLEERPGRELQVHGSWRLARALHEAGLVDVYEE